MVVDGKFAANTPRPNWIAPATSSAMALAPSRMPSPT